MTEYTEQNKYWIWLSSVEGIGSKNFFRLTDAYGEPKAVWEQLVLAEKLLTPAVFRHLSEARNEEYMESLFTKMEEAGIVAVTQLDDRYPDRLRSIADAPLTLYVRGNADALNSERAFGIVGSRKLSADGARFTQDIAEQLALNEVSIISGLAIGTDTKAHEGCLKGGMPTVAVLGCSPEIIYPSENLDLARRIIDNGGALISEYPPGTPPDKRNFPRRNRIISGMSDGVLMTEGTVKSGAMITMKYAAEQNRPTFAVPGSVYSEASEGTNRLIVEGTMACIGQEQITEFFSWDRKILSQVPDELPQLDDDSRKLVEILRFEEKSFNELCDMTGFDAGKMNMLLTILEMNGIIRQSRGKLYRAVK